MVNGYEINDLAKGESWRMFRIIGELVEGFDKLSDIEPALTIYGSARINTNDEIYKQTEEIARRLGKLGFSIITGGGPGVMEAANKGAQTAGVKSIGLHIDLPHEQACNTYATRAITFNHFFVRKVMLVKYALAFIIMPGGLGTLDELTEVLLLIQTHKIKPFPVILFKSKYWKGLLDWLKSSALMHGYISEEDFGLLFVCDQIDEVIDTVREWYKRHKVIGRKALNE
ncbi:TIGR00730 family Rossman fold protein [Chloroflexota bacterium]